ncbi:MAG: PolC-type DNA polymerase III, partial [Lachnospiraceae bacterium]|nr:PolC-type DNA polymerase III [Lachnospiraceae bacterium]
MTEKEFLDVFPQLKVENELGQLLRMVKVMKVSINPKKDCLRVYIMSNQWIQKKYIYHLENIIMEQFFSEAPLQVKIIEKFNLSRQYTPENFLEVYRPSILLELKHYSMLEYNMFATAQISFPETETMEMILDDSVVARERENELVRILEKIFCERCGFNLRIHTDYRKPVESKVRRNSELRIMEEARQILLHSNIGVSMEKNEDVPLVENSAVNSNEDNIVSENKKLAAESGKGKENKKSVRESAGSRKYSGKGSQRGDFQRGRFGDNAGPKPLRRSDNPDVIYGRDFDDEIITIESIAGEMGEVTIRGQVTSVEAREIRNEKTIYMFNITDFTDTITVKIFLHNEQVPEISQGVKKGAFLKLKGVTTIDKFDHEITIGSLTGIKKTADFTTTRMDNSPEKRVELHCHTKMSDMDGVTDASVLVKRAYKWGHPAIAITDHGVVQSFPEANHAYDDIVSDYRKNYQKEHPEATKDELKKVYPPFKVIYGVEAYLVDDLKGMVTGSQGQSLDQPYVVFDIETTGFSPVSNRIIEIGAVRVEKGEIKDRFSVFVNPQVPIPFKIEQLTSINDSMVMDAETIEEILPKFLKFSEGAVMVAHNAGFDMSFIIENCKRMGIEQEFTYVDTVGMARMLLPGLNRFKLDTVAKALNVSLQNHHRAVDDAACTAEIFVKFVKMCKERDITNLDQLNEAGKMSADTIKKLPTYHAIILATSEVGRVNLYRLVSKSHLDYYNRRPRIPKSVYLQYKEGLMIGSACEAGELFQAIVGDAPDSEIARLVEFYDYLEIQPIGNNMFMIRDENRDNVTSEEDLRDLNRRIVKLGEQFHKPVVATCDVHFIDPEDEIYRRIIMTGKGFSDADDQAPLYLRTTEEMLKEFEYLGAEKAEEVVITNPNKIVEMCDRVCPIRDGKFPPVIENSDNMLREICYNRAHEIYGENLPEIVSARLERELNSIISNGYAVMYIIAQKLVWKSNEDGYLVGSRGSVGSSFVATMAGITEVNPLSPHYYCEKCHYYDFDSPEVKAYTGRAGCDMPDAVCPNCGAPLVKAGFDIPFETFLGFKGNKEPDIDLNFSGEYQSKAHKYTEVIFGAGQTFRAGTIGTLADKTAFGYVKNYYEERGIHKRNCEIDRIVQGCTGIRRTTGQHPGGIIVLPFGEDINSFTPVQHPANDTDTDIITTHFDYHSIDANLLKLDILGHDDPTMIRMLEDLTGLEAQTIPLDNKEVMSLFKSTEALGITPEDIGGCPLGCLGVPEFGTDFVIQMLLDTKPTSFSDLIRISGLSHGTDVWLGNAQTLIEEGKATISTA